MVGKYLRIQLVISDAERSKAFYEDVLGFRMLQSLDDGYVSFASGSVILALSADGTEAAEFAGGLAGDARGAGVELIIEVDDVAAAYQRLLDSGWSRYEELRMQPWDLEDFRVTDPDGYYWCVTATDTEHSFTEAATAPGSAAT